MNEWTLISEKKPEPEIPVLVYDKSNDKYYVDELDHNGAWYGKGSFCDAWRPIEPYVPDTNVGDKAESEE